MDLEHAKQWIGRNRDLGMEAVRIYIGFAIFAQGVLFIQRGIQMMESTQLRQLQYDSILLVHFISISHLAGGVLMMFGLLTRAAAATQLPILLGAIVFVHGPGGLFAPAQGLQFALLVFFLLVLVTVVGGGRLSADHYLAQYAARHDALTGRNA
jgi:putative oxidoreductase